MLLLSSYWLKTDNFRFEPDVRGRWQLTLVQANSQDSITLVGPLKAPLWASFELKNANFRFHRKFVGGAQNRERYRLLRA